MYNPRTTQDLEWLELHNEMAIDMDISQWRIDGIDYTFPEGTVMSAGGYLVVAKSPAALQAATGLTGTLGPYEGRMDNAGESLHLINNSDRTMDEIDYSDRERWPVGPDGSGASLAKINPDGGSLSAANWTANLQVGGTPGGPNFTQGPEPVRTLQLVTSDASWRYDDRGVDLGTAWRTLEFDPDDPDGNGDPSDAWHSGNGLLGHVPPNSPVTIATPLDASPQTYYFRHEFQFDGDPTSTELHFDAIVDDGAVIYLNGQEVSRINMLEGPVDYTTFATTSVSSPEFTGEFQLTTAALRPGDNVLAVEVHQAADGVAPSESPPQSVLEIIPESGFSLTWTATDGEYFDAAAPPDGALVPDNAALATNGAVAFAGSDLGPEIGSSYHMSANLNDGRYGNSNSWIGGDNNPSEPQQFAGIALSEELAITAIAWGRDNGNNASDACGGQCTDRSLGTYTLQYTAVANVDGNTAETGDASTGWASIGQVTYGSDEDVRIGDGFTSFLRHAYDVRLNGEPVKATGIRIVVPASGLANGTAIDEIEIYTGTEAVAPDAVFGATLAATEFLSDTTTRLRFNELSAASSKTPFVELINNREQPVELTGYSIVSSDLAAPPTRSTARPFPPTDY